MSKESLWTIVGVVIAAVIAWWIVGAVFSVLWFFAKLALVAVVAVMIVMAMRAFFRSS